MIWLTWRQFRAAAAAAAGALAVLGAILALTGRGLADEFSNGLSSCSGGLGGSCSALGQQFFHDHRSAFLAVTALALATPALVGMFWGAPLVTRELEAGTHGLVWNQSITRTRWLATKMAVIGAAAMLATGLVSVAVSRWANPIDKAAAADFPRMEPILFAARGLAPVGYAAFAFAAGVAVGLLVRRTLPAMTITLAVFAVAQIAVPMLIRPHVLPAVQTTFAISDDNDAEFKVSRVGPDRVAVDAGDTGAWFVSSRTVDAAGNTVDAMELDPSGPCVSMQQDREACFAEMTARGYQIEVTYQPPSRFWPLQWIETGIYLTAAAGLTGCCLWLIRRRM